MAESRNFYEGGHQVTEDVSKLPSARVKRPKYKKDTRFTFDKSNDKVQRSLSIDSVMKKIHEKKEKLGVLAVVAPAGAGKTTCMCRWARSVMENSGMSKENEFTPRQGSRFQMVHFKDMKRIQMSGKVSLQDFLFKDLFDNANDTKTIYKWLLKNQDRVVIFLDGLDQAQQKITELDLPDVGKHGEASYPTILCNLMTRNLLPGVRIIISSREHAASFLPEQAWFSDVITLTGFSIDDAKKLFNAITTEDNVDNLATTSQQQPSRIVPVTSSPVPSTSSSHGDSKSSGEEQDQSNWDKVFKSCFALHQFISVPIFLMFTAIVYNTSGQTPASVTEMLVELFKTLPCSLVIQKKKSIWSIIHKLKKLSQNAMEKELVMFSLGDLKNCNLTVEEVQDLMVMVPRSRSLSHCLIEGDNMFFFCHQILQEFLSACYVVEMALLEFEIFVETNLDEGQWSVVRRFVCGLLFFLLPVDYFLQIPDKEKKQKILRESLRQQLRFTKTDSTLELYAAIYETNDECTINLITDINIGFKPLTRDGAHLIGALIGRRKELHSLSFICCGLDDEILGTMSKHISYSLIQKVRINEIVPHSSFTGWNNFFEHVHSDCFYSNGIPYALGDKGNASKLDWRNIGMLLYRPIEFHDHIIMFDRTTEDTEIVPKFAHKGEFLEDHANHANYDRENNTFEVKLNAEKCCFGIILTACASRWLSDPHSMELDIKGAPCTLTHYIHCKDTSLISDWNITGKLRNILLDYFTSVDFDEERPMIDDFVEFEEEIISLAEEFQVEAVDFVTQAQNIDDIPDTLADNLNGIKFRVHVCQAVRKTEDIQKHLHHLQRKQVESLRFVLDFEESPCLKV